MLILVSDRLSGKERRKFLRDYQLSYYISQGLTLDETAQNMGYSRRAITNYLRDNKEVREMLEKVGLKTSASFANYAIAEITKAIKNKLDALDDEEKFVFLGQLNKFIKNI